VSSGDLTLDGRGDANCIFVFQMASTLTVTSGRQVILINGASADRIFWQVGSSATFGAKCAFVGTVMTYASVTMTTGATLVGRSLAVNGAVTMDSNTVTSGSPVL
jgi:hypothetical protein